MSQARFTALARAELLAEVTYCENRRTGLGARFRAEVEAAYTEAGYGILIRAVAHNRRRPTYWIARLKDAG